MKKRRLLSPLISVSLIIGGLCALLISPSFSRSGKEEVHVLQLDGDSINPVTAEFISTSIDEAEDEDALALMIKLDTPGGLLTSTRSIVKRILKSEIPIIVYIAPSGSRAGSAGVFITYASHIAAMAPSTNIGAAHPVQIGGVPKQKGDWQELKELIQELREIKNSEKSTDQEGEEEQGDIKEGEDQTVTDTPEASPGENPMEDKLLNDTIAFIKSLARQRNRNIEWAELSVKKSESITHEEALKKGVIEYIAEDEADLLKQIDGTSVWVGGKEVILRTANASLREVDMSAQQKFFNVLANPNIAYFLMILGFYGLLFEITNPGIGFPGIMGAIFLILAMYSMQNLPTNYAGLALFVLGFVLLVAEAYTPTFGLLTLGGVVCLVLGSMLLFESVDPIMRVSRSFIFAFAFSTIAVMVFIIQAMIRLKLSKVQSGRQGLIGEAGEARHDFDDHLKGTIFVHGEIWNAVSDSSLNKGDMVEVVKVEGLTLHVQKQTKEG